MSATVYFDTSALAKWYINEAGSDNVEEYIQQYGPVAISDLTIVEMRSLLARRRRAGSLTSDQEVEIFIAFQEDIRRRSLECHPLPNAWAVGVVNLIALVPKVPVRTLDAIHLMVANELAVDILVTADRVMADAAGALGLGVKRF